MTNPFDNAKKSTSILSAFFRVPQIEIIMFAHHLSIMVKSGLSLSKSLAALEKQTKNAKFSEVIKKINIDVLKGTAFADALSVHSEVFDELFVNMIRIGEMSGSLDSTLSLLSEQMKKDYELRSKIKGAMTYPAVVLTAMVAVGVVVMVYIIPKLTMIFESMNVELPASTKFLIALSDLFLNHGVLILAALISLAIAAKLFLRGKNSRFLDAVILKLPIFGDISQKVNIARFARTTSSLIKGGVSISTALKTVSKTLSNYYYQESTRLAAERIEKGLRLKDSLGEFENLYSPLVLQMIEVGEETGSLDEILLDLAKFYEDEVSETTKNLSTIIEPVLMIVMGIAVGFFAISIIQPMYSIADTV